MENSFFFYVVQMLCRNQEHIFPAVFFDDGLRPTIPQIFFLVIRCIFREASGYLVPYIIRLGHDVACLVEQVFPSDSTDDKI